MRSSSKTTKPSVPSSIARSFVFYVARSASAWSRRLHLFARPFSIRSVNLPTASWRCLCSPFSSCHYTIDPVHARPVQNGVFSHYWRALVFVSELTLVKDSHSRSSPRSDNHRRGTTAALTFPSRLLGRTHDIIVIIIIHKYSFWFYLHALFLYT